MKKSAQGFRDLRFAQANHIAEMERLLLSSGERAQIDQRQAGNTSPTDNCFLREGRPRGRGLFTSATAPDVGPVHRVGSAMAASTAGVSLMVLVRGPTCDCSPKGAQHLRTIRILQADIVKKAIGHIVSVGPTTRHARLSQRSARLPKRFMMGAEGLEPSTHGLCG
jgi:hypothetical protein